MPSSGAESPGSHERQLSLGESIDSKDTGQCEAFADSTGERCQHDAITPIPYCGDHRHLLDDVDRERLGLKPSKSDV